MYQFRSNVWGDSIPERSINDNSLSPFPPFFASLALSNLPSLSPRPAGNVKRGREKERTMRADPRRRRVISWILAFDRVLGPVSVREEYRARIIVPFARSFIRSVHSFTLTSRLLVRSLARLRNPRSNGRLRNRSRVGIALYGARLFLFLSFLSCRWRFSSTTADFFTVD